VTVLGSFIPKLIHMAHSPPLHFDILPHMRPGKLLNKCVRKNLIYNELQQKLTTIDEAAGKRIFGKVITKFLHELEVRYDGRVM